MESQENINFNRIAEAIGFIKESLQRAAKFGQSCSKSSSKSISFSAAFYRMGRVSPSLFYNTSALNMQADFEE
jgi:hypothetical protein